MQASKLKKNTKPKPLNHSEEARIIEEARDVADILAQLSGPIVIHLPTNQVTTNEGTSTSTWTTSSDYTKEQYEEMRKANNNRIQHIIEHAYDHHPKKTDTTNEPNTASQPNDEPSCKNNGPI